MNLKDISKFNKDLTQITWKDPNYEIWLSEYNAGKPIEEWEEFIKGDTALEYFSNSSFYEKKSTNEKLKNQNADFNENHRLIFPGIEFVVERPQEKDDPNICIIVKQYRENENVVYPISYYYICQGVIYQAPNLYSLISRNVENLSNSMMMLLDSVKGK